MSNLQMFKFDVDICGILLSAHSETINFIDSIKKSIDDRRNNTVLFTEREIEVFNFIASKFKEDSEKYREEFDRKIEEDLKKKEEILEGKIDNVKVYDRALTSSEIAIAGSEIAQEQRSSEDVQN